MKSLRQESPSFLEVLSACLVQHSTKGKFISLCCKDLYASSEYSSSVFYVCLMLNNSASSVEAIKHVLESRFQSHEGSTFEWRDVTQLIA
jgi:hypothetical protein